MRSPIYRPRLAPEWPPVADSVSIAAKIRQIHASPQDFEEGDLLSRIHRYSSFSLKLIAVTDYDPTQFALCDKTVKEYSANTNTAPPIVVDPESSSVIDGCHRLAAAIDRGDSHIWAYVGEVLDPDWDPDEICG
jgi:hypothetical protein